MTTTTEPQSSPRDTFLTVPEVFERYRWKRSRGYLMLDEPGFPARIGNGYRLDTLYAWEDALLAQGSAPQPADAPGPSEPAEAAQPVAKKRLHDVSEPVALPAKRRTGRKAA